MASREVDPAFEVSAEETSNLVHAFARKLRDENNDLTTSDPAVLEPSEADDDPLFKREKIKRSSKKYRSIMKSYNSTEIFQDSEETSTVDEEETRASSSVWVRLFDGYKNFAATFRNSSLIYILQTWSILLPFSATVMGNIYATHCPASPHLIGVTVVTGMIGMLLAGQWFALHCCPPDDRPCEGQQKYGILISFIIVSVMLEYEIYLFYKMSPSFEPSTTTYCDKFFYDYTYYKFISAFGSMLAVLLLYIPSYISIASGVKCSNPLTASCYKEIMEADE